MISVVVVSKDEPALDRTLAALERELAGLGSPAELVVVDASDGRLDGIRDGYPAVQWLPFIQPADVPVTIPHQRNAGVRAASGDVIAFTDAGCLPEDGWLTRLVAPIARGEEDVTAGRTLGSRPGGMYDSFARAQPDGDYLDECPTINMAFRRSAFDAVGGFDEGFEYGSDIDFSWRLVDAGRRIRHVADAVVEHDWGAGGRQLRRSYAYGRARARLYAKHRGRLARAWRDDPVPFVYPLFLLGLPLTLRFKLYPALLLVPAWRNRDHGAARVLVDHLAYGAGALSGAIAR